MFRIHKNAIVFEAAEWRTWSPYLLFILGMGFLAFQYLRNFAFQV